MVIIYGINFPVDFKILSIQDRLELFHFVKLKLPVKSLDGGQRIIYPTFHRNPELVPLPG